MAIFATPMAVGAGTGCRFRGGERVPPSLPFGWFDAPAAINRLLGLQWLARLLYPQVFDQPLGPRVKEFHRRFYQARRSPAHREPTDAEVSALLGAAGGLR